MINPVAMDVIHNNITKANSLYVGTFCLDRLYNQVGEFSSDVSFGRFSTARMLHVNNKPESLVYKKIMRKEPFVDSILANIDDYKTFFVYAFKDFPDKVFDFMNPDLFLNTDTSWRSTLYKLYKQSWHCLYDPTAHQLVKKIIRI